MPTVAAVCSSCAPVLHCIKESKSVADRLEGVAPAFIKELPRRAELVRLRGDVSPSTSLSAVLDAMNKHATPALRRTLNGTDSPAVPESRRAPSAHLPAGPKAIETFLGARPGRGRLLAAGAGASGRDDISERIEEILANEVQPSL